MAYAENTEVSVDKSVGEIVTLIKKAGANRIAQAEEPGRIIIQFFLHERLLRFAVQLPGIETVPTYDGGHRRRTEAQREQKMLQRHKQRARALLLVIKAKLESVESGVETFEEAFLSNVVMPNGQTIGEMATPQITHAYESGAPQPLMLTGG